MYNHLIIANLKRGVNLKISVLGCGRWGSFIAWYLDKIGHEVKMWGRRDSHHLQEIKTLRRNSYLKFPKSINVTDDLEECLKFSNTIIISISAQSLRTFSESLNALGINLNEKTFVLCMKGIEENTGKRLSQVIKESIFYKINIAIWVGPGHVQDFAGGIPNCMVIDSENNSVKNYLVENFSSNIIRFYYGTDLLGNEIGAAAKNVMGIAAGILDGMNYESLKGALMSRGTREIARLIKAMGGSEMSAYGLAHLGDYQATLFSPHSNNRKFGEFLVIGKPYDKLAEGVPTSHAILELGKKYSVELPICKAVYESVTGKTAPEKAIAGLFLRSIKNEF